MVSFISEIQYKISSYRLALTPKKFLSHSFQNELEDALRKRKGQSDVSDEDLGLPSSPSTSQRNGNHLNERAPGLSPFRHHTQANHSPLNMLSMDSSELDDDSFTSTTPGFLTSSGYLSSSKLNMSFSSTRTSDDELLAPSSDMSGRLSHSAARHKMAIRPKKNAPSRRGRISDAVSRKEWGRGGCVFGFNEYFFSYFCLIGEHIPFVDPGAEWWNCWRE